MWEINHDCRYFKWNRPCRSHKKLGIHCENCTHYDKVDFKILIIKLDAPGDVLRTTCILPGLRGRHPRSHITWLTRKESLCLFENNLYVDQLLEYGVDAVVYLQTEVYDLVISPDASMISMRLASMAKAKRFMGLCYDSRVGSAYSNWSASEWFQMGVFDDVKKANTSTYQKIVTGMTGINSSNYDTILNLSDDEKTFAEDFAILHGVNREGLVIGLNVGAGSRWQNKKWTLKGYIGLISLIVKRLKGAQILMYGGPEEVNDNGYLLKAAGGWVVSTGCNNLLREFAALLSLCDVLVTGDTMALHIALALKKKVVVLFGPTSSVEIELYGRGCKVFAQMDCLCCYESKCSIKPNCMDNITPEMVFNAIEHVIQ